MAINVATLVTTAGMPWRDVLLRLIFFTFLLRVLFSSILLTEEEEEDYRRDKAGREGLDLADQPGRNGVPALQTASQLEEEGVRQSFLAISAPPGQRHPCPGMQVKFGFYITYFDQTGFPPLGFQLSAIFPFPFTYLFVQLSFRHHR